MSDAFVTDPNLPSISWNHDEVPDSLSIPVGMPVEMEVTESALVMSKGDDQANKKPKLMAVVKFSVVMPEDYKNLTQTERYVLGNEEDPMCSKQATFNRSAVALKKLIDSSQVAAVADFKAQVAALVTAHVGIEAKIEKSRDARYVDKPRIVSYFKLGTKQVPLLSSDFVSASGVGGVVPSAAAVAATATDAALVAARAKLSTIEE